MQGESVMDGVERRMLPVATTLRAMEKARRVLAGIGKEQGNGGEVGSAGLKLFVSHAKIDGVPVALSLISMLLKLRQAEGKEGAVGDFEYFYDVEDLELGKEWEQTLKNEASRGLLIALRTEAYERRYWCQQEFLLAESNRMPILVVDLRTEQYQDSGLLPFEAAPSVRVHDGDAAHRTAFGPGLRRDVRGALPGQPGSGRPVAGRRRGATVGGSGDQTAHRSGHVGDPPVCGCNRLRPVRRVRGLRNSRRAQVLRPEQTALVHVRAGTPPAHRRRRPGPSGRARPVSGPIASNIAREAPFFLKPLLVPVMKLAFSSPARAARSVTYLCCSEDAGERSGIYLHMMQKKEPSKWAMDPRCGARLWEASAALVHKHAPTTKPIG